MLSLRKLKLFLLLRDTMPELFTFCKCEFQMSCHAIQNCLFQKAKTTIKSLKRKKATKEKPLNQKEKSAGLQMTKCKASERGQGTTRHIFSIATVSGGDPSTLKASLAEFNLRGGGGGGEGVLYWFLCEATI